MNRTCFRANLIHGYHGVDLDIVWNMVTEDLPVLTDALESMLG